MQKTSRRLFVFILFCSILLGAGAVSAQVQSFAQAPKAKHTLADYGLTPDSVKYLTPAEIQRILNSKTPAETNAAKKDILSAVSTSSPQSVKAAFSVLQANPPSLASARSMGTSTAGIVDCSDYYKFGSVQANLSMQSQGVVPGMIAQFSGTLTNSNKYPVTDGTLYVKIFKIKGTAKDSNGPDVVDQFIAMDHVAIPANSSVRAAVSWAVPLHVRGGEYQLATFFVVDKKFNLLGLSFTNDVVGNTFDFAVKSSDAGLYFNNAAVKINDQPYHFAAFPPQIAGNDSANVVATIDNTTGKDEVARITWKLYRWDAMDPSNLIRTISTSTLVKANSTANVSVSISDKDFPVYYLVGELSYKDAPSVVDIRFVREGVDRLRLNFPSILQYPLAQNATSTMFTCLSNSGTSPVVPDGKVVLQLKDGSGTIINSYTYAGPVTGDMMAVKSDFVPPADASTFSINAELWQSGKIVDKATIVYDCSIIDPSICSKSSGSVVKPQRSDDAWLYTASSVIGLLLVLVFAVAIRKKKARATSSLLLIPILFILAPSFFLRVSSAQTNYTSLQPKSGSVIWTNSESNLLDYFWNGGGVGAYSGWETGLGQRYESIQYNTQILNASTSAVIASGASVPVGTQLTLKFLPHASSDISWFGSGYSLDSPYGEWSANSAPQAPACLSKDYVTKYHFFSTQSYDLPELYYDVYIPLVVSPPAKTISNTGNMSCSSLTGNEASGYTMQCTVNATGAINPKFNFAPTSGMFFYRYFGKDYSATTDACIANNIPMQEDRGPLSYLGIPAMFAADGVVSVFGNTSSGTSYALNVPAQTIQYNLTATPVVQSNQPPTAPAISGLNQVYSNVSNSFDFTSTDPDSDQIQYGVDWDNDGVIDQYLPASGLVNSGVSESASKAWSVLGAQNFQAKAIDSHGAASTWAQYSVNVVVQNPNILNVAKSGSGSGTVSGTGDPVTANNINCGSICSDNVASVVPITLTVVPAAGSTFAGWSNGGAGNIAGLSPCDATNNTTTCHINVSGTVSVTAAFNQTPAALAVSCPASSISATFSGGGSHTISTGSASAAGGVGPYTYAWSDGASFPAFSASPSATLDYTGMNGTYNPKVKVKDASGNTAISPSCGTVTVSTSPAVSFPELWKDGTPRPTSQTQNSVFQVRAGSGAVLDFDWPTSQFLSGCIGLLNAPLPTNLASWTGSAVWNNAAFGAPGSVRLQNMPVGKYYMQLKCQDATSFVRSNSVEIDVVQGSVQEF